MSLSLSLSYSAGISHLALVPASRFSWVSGLNKSTDGDLSPVAVEVSDMMAFLTTVSHCVYVLVFSSRFLSADGSVKVEGDGLVSVQVSDMMSVPVSS